MARKRTPKGVPDWHLWTAVSRTVVPLRQPVAEPEPEAETLPMPPAARPAVRIAKPALKPLPVPTPRKRPQPPDPGLEPKLRRRLTRGRIDIDGTIDLHGMRQAEAFVALKRFVRARALRGDRTILVITGKGLKKLDDMATTIVERGVLRAMLPLWLSDPDLRPMIAGYAASAQVHGGDGAFYVRLRKPAE